MTDANKGLGGIRRLYATRAAVVTIAGTASLVFVLMIAASLPTRIDMTASGEHQLSPQTRARLATLANDYRVVAAIDPTRADAARAQRTLDVMSEMDRISERVSTTVINTASPSGADEFTRLIDELVARYQGVIDEADAEVRGLIAEARAIAEFAAPFADRVESIPVSAPENQKRAFATEAVRLRLVAREVERAADEIEKLLGERLDGLPLAPVDQAVRGIRQGLEEASNKLDELNNGLRFTARDDRFAAGVQANARNAAAALTPWRDRAARAAQRAADVEPPPVVSVARRIGRSQAVLAIGPPGVGVTALDVEALFPPPNPAAGELERARTIDTGIRAEELVSSTLALMDDPDAPVVTLVHGADARLAPTFQAISIVADRLRMKGVALEEWAAALEPDPPPSPRADGRQSVYVFVPWANAQGQAGLVRALETLLARGDNVLVSIGLSTNHGLGAPDPFADALAPTGLAARSDLALLSEFVTPERSLVDWQTTLVGAGAEHPISDALAGLRLGFQWACPLEVPTADGVWSCVPVLLSPDGNGAWAESDWFGFRRLPPGERVIPANLPKPDPDSKDDLTGPWTIAAALERVGADGVAQRLLVVGADGWFTDQVVGARTQSASGAVVADTPGNAELFEAAVYWLAERDELIARSASAQAVSYIGPISPAVRSRITWGLTLGLPLGILGVGALLRVLRR